MGVAMRTYRWMKVRMDDDANCEKCGQKISAGTLAWERTGWLSFNEYEAQRDTLEKIYFCTSHFIPPEGKIIIPKNPNKLPKCQKVCENMSIQDKLSV
jgi:hypothetical protein